MMLTVSFGLDYTKRRLVGWPLIQLANFTAPKEAFGKKFEILRQSVNK